MWWWSSSDCVNWCSLAAQFLNARRALRLDNIVLNDWSYWHMVKPLCRSAPMEQPHAPTLYGIWPTDWTAHHSTRSWGQKFGPHRCRHTFRCFWNVSPFIFTSCFWQVPYASLLVYRLMELGKRSASTSLIIFMLHWKSLANYYWCIFSKHELLPISNKLGPEEEGKEDMYLID